MHAKPEGRPKFTWDVNIKSDFNETGVRIWTGFICLKIYPVAGPCEYSNELSCFINE
jgi:hypothetical protein